MNLLAILQLATQVTALLQSPAGQGLLKEVQTVEALIGQVTGVVTGLLNGVHAGVNASTVAQLPVATVATSTQAGV